MKQLNQTQEWLAAFRRGDLQPVRDLYEVHFSSLVHFSEQIIHDSAESHEIVTGTFIKLLNRRAWFDGQADIRAFLYLTTRNACMDFLRFARTGQLRAATPAPPPECTTDLADINNRLKADQILLSAFENLPIICQQVFRSLFIDGNTITAAAHHLEMDQRQLLNYRKQCLHHLRAALAEKGLYSTPFFVHYLTGICGINGISGINDRTSVTTFVP